VYIAPNGAAFDTNEQGIMSIAVAQVFGLRKRTKAEMKRLEKEREQMISNSSNTTSITDQVGTLNIYQRAYKTAINSLYGLHGSEFFRYYHPAIAEAITSSGVLINQHFMARINHWIEHGNAEFDLTPLRNKHYDEAYINGLRNIIAGDTDSSMITLAKRLPADLSGEQLIDAMSVVSDELTSNFKAWASEITECTNMMPGSVDKLNYKREKFADIGLFRAKKNYAMRVYDNEGVRYATPELYVKGLESVKVSTPGWAQDALERVYESILNGVNPKPIVDKVRAWHENCDIMDVSKTQRVNNVDDSNGHVSTGAKAYNKMASEFNAKPITNGSLVQWFYLTEPNPVRNNTIAIPTTEPSKQILNIIAPYIDRKLMFEKSIGDAAQSVAVLGDYDISNKRTMANFLIKKKV
jgi:DNA polymerase elongation subunit (family B)